MYVHFIQSSATFSRINSGTRVGRLKFLNRNQRLEGVRLEADVDVMRLSTMTMKALMKGIVEVVEIMRVL